MFLPTGTVILSVNVIVNGAVEPAAPPPKSNGPATTLPVESYTVTFVILPFSPQESLSVVVILIAHEVKETGSPFASNSNAPKLTLSPSEGRFSAPMVLDLETVRVPLLIST